MKYEEISIELDETKEEERICEVEHKICYSARRAGEILNSNKRHIRSQRKHDKPIRKYFCKHCKMYHLTSTPWFRECMVEKKSAKRWRKMKYGY